ncbi:MAG: triose-phosphate isomerase, partial [Nitrospiraceae bacterium]|nr:triose-phosphate isomerase [Nitrospiraceae bacterium]
KDVTDVDKLIAPPFTSLNAVATAAAGSGIIVAAQDVFYEEQGAFTGEISPGMIKDAGGTFVIIGHSERRQYFHETDSIVNKKSKAALRAGLGVVLCIGETLEERNTNRTFDVVKRQIAEGLAEFCEAEFKDTVIAYEPVWAIGTGVTATPEQAEEAHGFIRSIIKEIYGDLADEMRILYGGSVKPENVDEIMASPNVDGALVGGASLDPQVFSKLVKFRRG